MSQINLLPWREQARQAKKVRFSIRVAVSAALAIFCVLIIHLYYQGVAHTKNKRNAYLQQQLSAEQTELNTLNQKRRDQDQIVSELKTIFTLRENSYDAVALLDALARVVPDAVSFSSVIRQGNVIVVTGKARSNPQITTLMKNISKLDVFKQANLTEIMGKDDGAGEYRQFKLTVEMRDRIVNEKL